MNVQVIKTRKFLPPKDNLWALLESSIKKLEEKSVVVITSKIISIAEGRCVPVQTQDKDKLTESEADYYLSRDLVPGKWLMHTLTKNHLIASAGIDKSNGKDCYILWPKNAQKSAKEIWQFLRKKYAVSNVGVVITDSHTVPLHRGLVGMCIAFYGFLPLRDYRGKKDIFGGALLMSQTNIPDALAAAAVFEMGEGAEQTPLAVISDLGSKVKFTTRHPELVSGSKQKMPQVRHDKYESFQVPLKEDLFYPFLKAVPWKKGGI